MCVFLELVSPIQSCNKFRGKFSTPQGVKETETLDRLRELLKLSRKTNVNCIFLSAAFTRSVNIRHVWTKHGLS